MQTKLSTNEHGNDTHGKVHMVTLPSHLVTCRVGRVIDCHAQSFVALALCKRECSADATERMRENELRGCDRGFVCE